MKTLVKPLEIIHSAKSKGINLFVDQGRLAIKKGKDVALSAELMELIKENKPELIHFLEEEVQPSKANLLNIKNVEKSEKYQVSNAQRRLWYASQVEEGSIAQNTPSTLVLNGTYDIAHFQKAIHAVIERHEILRTIFKMDDDGEVWQYVLTPEALGFSIDYKDYRKEKDIDSAWRKYVLQDSYKPFDLAKGPLLRTSLLQLSDEEYIFYYNMHHIISDGWSMEVLSKDVMTYYTAYVAGTTPELAPLNIQYKDYANWQLEQLNSPSYQAHKDYWLSQFNDEVVTLDLPTQKKRPQLKTYNGRHIGVRISPEMTTRLRNFTVDRGGSLFMGLLAVMKILLYRYTGETDIVIGNPVSSRNHPDLENQIGFYVNTLALRNQIDPNCNFKEFYDEIKVSTIEAQSHQMYPFDQMLENLNIKRDISRNPLFDILFDYHGVSEGGSALDDRKELHDLGTGKVKFDLEFDPTEVEGGVNIMIGYNIDVYENEMVENFVIHYKKLLEKLLANPDACIGKISFLSEEENNKLLNEFNNSQIAYPQEQTIVDLFVAQAQKTPDAVALVFEEESLTYKELDDLSNQLAHYLKQRGVGRDTLVPICAIRSLDMIVSMLGIIKSGGAYVPIDPSSPQQRLDFILEDIECSQLLTHSSLANIFESYEEELEVIYLDNFSSTLESYSKLPLDISIEPDQLVYVIYTSGTTGTPKGVMIEHRNLSDYVHGLLMKLEIDVAYSYGLMSTPSADLGNTVLFTALVTGGVLHTFSKEMLMNAYDLLSYFNNQKIDIIKIVPSHWLSLSIADEILVPQKAIIFGGEVLRNEVINKIKNHAPLLSIINHYGPTETTIGKLLYKVNLEQEYRQVPLGKPFSNARVYILDRMKNLLPLGSEGELYIDGAGLARGYLNRPDLTADKFTAHPFVDGEKIYNTGDIARWLPEGNIGFVGRRDNQIKIRGYRIELEEIESVLNELHNIEQSVVLAKEDNSGSKRLIAYVVLREFGNMNTIKEGLTLVLEEKLPDYMVPNIYVKLDKMPLTSNGKIDRKALPVPDVFQMMEDYIAPSNEEEKVLVAIWESILGHEKISIKDNFYVLGGDSIKSIQLLNHLRKKGYILEVKDSIQNPVLKDMAKLLKKETKDKEESLFEPELLKHAKEKITEVSVNQEYFLNRPYAVIVSDIIPISNFSENTFKNKLLNLLSLYPSLLTVFEKKGDGNEILQGKVSADELQLDIKIIKNVNEIKTFEADNFTKIKEAAKEFLKKPFDYVNGSPLIRFFVVIDPDDSTKSYLVFSIAHALVDIDTFENINQNIINHLDDPKLEESHFSNFDFAIWQKNFLKNEQGKTERSWWLDYLAELPLDVKGEKNEGVIEYTAQSLMISGSEFEAIKKIAANLNLPVSILFLAAHQILLNELMFEKSSLQMIAVDGREGTYGNNDVKEVLGLTTNFFPLEIRAFKDKTFQEYIYDVYEQYIKVRMHQNIPYEVIRKDFLQQTNKDIDKALKGYFNFRSQENKNIKNITDRFSISSKEIQRNDIYGLGLICDLFENGINITLMCPKELYENVQHNLCLKSFVENKLLKK